MTNREFFPAIPLPLLMKSGLLPLTQMSTLMYATKSGCPSCPIRQITNEPIKASILAFVREHAPVVAADIAVACEISTPKASALCVQMVKEGKLTSTEVKVPQKGKVKAYALPENAK